MTNDRAQPRINCHVHVFNLRTVLTPRSLEVIRRRVEHDVSPDWLADVVGRLLAEVLDELPHLNEEELLRRLLRDLARHDRVAELLRDIAPEELPEEVRPLLTDSVERLALVGLRHAVTWLVGRLRRGGAADHRTTDLYDILQTLRIAGRPDIRDVTDWLLDQLDPDDVVVPLMMDITAGAPEDTPLFVEQLEATSRAILAYPGRVLPFVAVNPLRTDRVEVGGVELEGAVGVMRHALEEMGFVGVKLYPSLGYRVDSEALQPVYEYCHTHGVPMLMHCNSGGFVVSEEATQYPNPRHWRAILKRPDLAGLKICFAHFGGGGTLARQTIPVDSWAAEILRLMEEHDGVYADISFHRKPMDGDQAAGRYRRNLTGLVDDPRFAERILYGTDFWMIRPRLSEASHLRFFERLLGEATFGAIASKNPRRFLGLPPHRGNRALDLHLDFVLAHADDVEAMPAGWLLAAVEARHGADARRALEGAGSRFLPAARLPVPGWRELAEHIGERTLADGLPVPLRADADQAFTFFEDARLGLEAGATLTAEVLSAADGSDPDGVLLPPAGAAGPGLRPQLIPRGDSAWLKYRLEARLTAGIDVARLGLRLAADRSVVLADYRRHAPDERLATALAADLAHPRVALSGRDVLRLADNEALSLAVRGELDAHLVLSWQDVLAGGLARLGGVLAAGRPVALRTRLGATVAARVRVADDFRVVFARQGGRYRMVVRKLDSRSHSLGISVGASLQIDDPGAAADLVTQLVAQHLEAGSDELARLLGVQHRHRLDAAGRALLGRLQQSLGARTLEAVRERVAELEEQVRDRLERIARTRIEAGFSYEYARLEADATLCEATLDERALAELHGQLVQGDLRGLLDRARRGDPDVELHQLLRQREVVRRRAWGLSLGPVAGRDVRERRWAVQRGLASRVKMAFLGQRGYQARWAGDEWRWRVDLQADMTDLTPEDALRLGALPGHPPVFRYGLAFLLQLSDRRLKKTTLRRILDTAVLWGALPDDEAVVEAQMERFEQERLLRKPVDLRVQLVLDHATLQAVLGEGGDAATAADAFAAAMAHGRWRHHGSPTARLEAYGPLWRRLFQVADEEPGFRLDELTRRLAARARETLRRPVERDGQGAWTTNPWTFGGAVLLGPPVEPWRRFAAGLAALHRAMRSSTVQPVEDIQREIEQVFRELSLMWSHPHHLRAAGRHLLDRADAAGSVAMLRPSLTATWSHRDHEQTMVVATPR